MARAVIEFEDDPLVHSNCVRIDLDGMPPELDGKEGEYLNRELIQKMSRAQKMAHVVMHLTNGSMDVINKKVRELEAYADGRAKTRSEATGCDCPDCRAEAEGLSTGSDEFQSAMNELTAKMKRR